jgi:hypothetical protein
MRNFLLTLFAILSLQFSSTISADNTESCVANGSGAIEYPHSLSSNSYTDTYCAAEPDYYGMTFYEMGLCTSAPTAPTTSSNLITTNCSTVMTSTAGSLVEIANGVTGSLGGTQTRPANGTYTHGYIRLSNDFLVEASKEFWTDSGTTGMTITNLSGDYTGTTGKYCATREVTYNNDGSSGTASTICDSSAPTAETLTARLVDLSGGDAAGYMSTVQAGGAIEVTGGTLHAYLLDSNNNLASSSSGVTGLVGVQEFTSPIVVTEDSASMDAQIIVTKAMTVSNNGSNTGVAFDSGPFSVILTIN